MRSSSSLSCSASCLTLPSMVTVTWSSDILLSCDTMSPNADNTGCFLFTSPAVDYQPTPQHTTCHKYCLLQTSALALGQKGRNGYASCGLCGSVKLQRVLDIKSIEKQFKGFHQLTNSSLKWQNFFCFSVTHLKLPMSDHHFLSTHYSCLLYTSDAADE